MQATWSWGCYRKNWWWFWTNRWGSLKIAQYAQNLVTNITIVHRKPSSQMQMYFGSLLRRTADKKLLPRYKTFSFFWSRAMVLLAPITSTFLWMIRTISPQSVRLKSMNHRIISKEFWHHALIFDFYRLRISSHLTAVGLCSHLSDSQFTPCETTKNMLWRLPTS